ncbi:MAG: iron ABC transporter permease [Ndongobacter sp.]|nr:iron ABC transporter permease [Ndongobacter sp.]
MQQTLLLAEAKKKKRKKHRLILALLGAALVTGFFSMCLGRYPLSVGEIVDAFAKLIRSERIDPNVNNVLMNIRLPRVLLAALAGAGLSLAGAAFQSLFSNPLATPDTLGVASGASFGAVLALLFGLPFVMVQGLAMIFGAIAVIMVYLVSATRSERSTIMLVLSGMVVSALFQALVSVVKLCADPQNDLPAITFWLMGGLSSVTYSSLLLSAPFILIGVFLIWLLRWRLNAMSLHREEAQTLGINVRLIRLLLIFASTMITAAVVSVCGQIGWVGLLIPHVSRMIFGNDNRYVISASVGLGALFFILIDTVARTATAAEIPVSILTALIGAPVFIVLLRKTGGVSV